MLANLDDYHRPQSAEEAVELVQEQPDERVYLAGGTYLIPHHISPYSEVVDLQELDLTGLSIDEERVELGALCRVAQIQKSDRLADLGLEPLAEAALNKPSQLIRNQATVGGELASGEERSDLATVLRALPTELTVQSPDNTRTLSIREFYNDLGQPALEPAELIRGISLPVLEDDGLFYDRVARTENDRPLVSISIYCERDDGGITDTRVAAAGVAQGIVRLVAVEDLVERHDSVDQAIEELEPTLEDAVSPPDDFRASSEYRTQVATTLIKRGLTQLDGRTNQ